MRKRLACVSTGPGVVPVIDGQVRRVAPEIDVLHVVDSSIVADIAAADGRTTPQVRQRVLAYVHAAETAAAGVVLVTCSSISEVVDQVQPFSTVPVMKIDEPMAIQAVTTGRRVGVVATLETTLGPTQRLIERIARERGIAVNVRPALCDGAFQALAQGDEKTHDQMIRRAVGGLLGIVDAIVLAQVSMARAVEALGQTPVPVLTSLESGVLAAVQQLAKL